jgi:hypothetical protein
LLLHGAKEQVNPHPRPRLRRSSRAATTPKRLSPLLLSPNPALK